MLNLFKPGKIGKLEIKNRIVMGSMGGQGLIELDGRYSQRGIDFYAARAAGGTGLIVTGGLWVDMEVEPHFIIPPFCWRPRMDSPLFLTRLEELVNAVHACGAKIAVQLATGLGRIAPSAEQIAGRAVAPSPIPCFWPPHVKPRELTTEEVEKLVRAFGISAGIVKSAGVDAIDLNGHGGYFLDQFTTALWNKRTDKYGGDLEGRLRFPLEIIETIRAQVGPDFPIMYKFGASHHLSGGRDIEESCEMARHLQQAGIDALTIDAGCYETQYWAHPPTYMPPGCYLDGIEAIKKVVDIPVIALGKLGYPELAEEVLRNGKADFIELARPLLADPDWPLKVKAGRLDDIRMCIGCQDGCLGRTAKSKYLSCAVNPATGMERELALTPVQKKKNVLVIGGGPAGMEAARVAALRGHHVTLCEKSDKLGGNLIPASVPEFKKDLALFLDYLSNQVRKLGVDIELMKEVTPELVKGITPDEVIIATGAMPIVPEFAWGSREEVITAVDVLLGKKEAGDDIVIAGGGHVGCETALWLARKGKRVTVVEILADVLQNMYYPNRMLLLKMINEAGINILTNTGISDISGNGIAVQKGSETQHILKADTVVLAVGMKAERGLRDELEGELPAIHAVGDCVNPRKIIDAIWEGFRAARLI